MTNILGIDPGKKGAFALLDTGTNRVTTQDMPDTLQGLQALLIALPPVHVCVLEQIHAGPQMARRTVGVMFEGYGQLKAALFWQGIPVRTIRPADWKGALNIPADKSAARRRACEFFPDDADQWARAKDDGRAEAALIAWYGMRWK